jgi:hypothetical protein
MNTTVRRLVDDLDQQTRHTPVPAAEIKPPSYGGPQRDAINSVVDNVVGDICGKIGELRKTLDAIEQQVLESAAGAKTTLQDHISICVKVNDEITHMQEVVEEIRANAPHGK